MLGSASHSHSLCVGSRYEGSFVEVRRTVRVGGGATPLGSFGFGNRKLLALRFLKGHHASDALSDEWKIDYDDDDADRPL